MINFTQHFAGVAAQQSATGFLSHASQGPSGSRAHHPAPLPPGPPSCALTVVDILQELAALASHGVLSPHSARKGGTPRGTAAASLCCLMRAKTPIVIEPCHRERRGDGGEGPPVAKATSDMCCSRCPWAFLDSRFKGIWCTACDRARVMQPGTAPCDFQWAGGSGGSGRLGRLMGAACQFQRHSVHAHGQWGFRLRSHNIDALSWPVHSCRDSRGEGSLEAILLYLTLHLLRALLHRATVALVLPTEAATGGILGASQT